MKRRLYILVLTMAAVLPACLEQQDREFANLVDRDGDGLGQFEDCDDNNRFVTTIAQEQGCGAGQYCAEDGHCVGNALCVSGVCVCADRFTGQNCDVCADDHYVGSNCDVCAERFTGDDCDVCAPQFVGENCEDCAENLGGDGGSQKNELGHGAGHSADRQKTAHMKYFSGYDKPRGICTTRGGPSPQPARHARRGTRTASSSSASHRRSARRGECRAQSQVAKPAG